MPTLKDMVNFSMLLRDAMYYINIPYVNTQIIPGIENKKCITEICSE